MKILCFLANGFEEIEAVGSIGLLRRSNFIVDVYSLEGTSATGKYNSTLSNLLDLKDLDYTSYDCLLLPGGPHYRSLEHNPQVIEAIHYFMKHDKYIAAICAAPTILGRLGYLKNKYYTCFTSMNDSFGGTYLDTYTAIDGNLITGRSEIGRAHV